MCDILLAAIECMEDSKGTPTLSLNQCSLTPEAWQSSLRVCVSLAVVCLSLAPQFLPCQAVSRGPVCYH